MAKVITSINKPPIGVWAKNVRISLRLTQKEIADKCGLSSKEVDSFENNLPVRLEVRIKLLKTIWILQRNGCQTFPR